MAEQKINKESTIQKILDWANGGIGRSINIEKFNQLMKTPDWEKELKEIAEFCKVEIVYE